MLHSLCKLGPKSGQSVGLTSVLLLKTLLTWLLFRSVSLLLLLCIFKLLPLGVDCWNSRSRFRAVSRDVCSSLVLHSTISLPLLLVFLYIFWSSPSSAGLPWLTGFSRSWRYFSRSRRPTGLRPRLTSSYLVLIFTRFSLKD